MACDERVMYCVLIQDVCICVIVSRLSLMAAQIDLVRVAITDWVFAVTSCSR